MANKQCDGCVYWRRLTGALGEINNPNCCHDCIDNGKTRKRDGDVCLSRREARPKEKKEKVT